MIISNEKGKSFEYYVKSLRTKYGNDLKTLIYESNKDIFLLRRTPNNWFMNVPLSNLQVGKFYIILYDFNGNKLYCPIFTIDYRVTENNKHVLYAMNLDYLPFDYKLLYFSKMYENFSNIFESNKDSDNFISESPLPVSFEKIYKTLETNGKFNYCISAFDILKIKECWGVSTNYMYIMIHVHMRPVNISLMKKLSEQYDDISKERIKLTNIINNLDDAIETYEQDVQSYYKKLRNIENNYKLFED